MHFSEDGAEAIPVEAVDVSESEDEMAMVKSVEFSAESFSVYGVVYTVDFTYEGKTLHFPGEGKYLLSEILSELGIEGDIESAELTLIEGEDHEGALYLEERKGVYWICSEIAFKDTYELDVKIGNKIYNIVVRDISYDMRDAVSSVSVEGLSGDTWTVKEGETYNLNISFEETPSVVQFPTTGNVLEYQLPNNFTPGALTDQPVTLTYTEASVVHTITGCTYSVTPDGKARIHKDHAKLLLANILNKNPLELLLFLDEQVDEEKATLYKKEVEAIENNKPLQYVIGKVNFYGSEFIVNEKVLIPRFETEELVENTIKKINEIFNNKNIKILDIGCGSGVIGLTLKKFFPESEVTLVDISKEALEVAKENAKNLNLEVDFIESDVFQNVYDIYDVIISNPPYIMDDEEIEDIVRDNEPHIALYAGKDGLDCYKKIMQDIKMHLNNKYLISFEIGRYQAPSIISMANYFLSKPTIEVKKDLQERDRMVFITN